MTEAWIYTEPEVPEVSKVPERSKEVAEDAGVSSTVSDVTIVVDVRERSLLECLTRMVSDKNKNNNKDPKETYAILSRQLDVADVQILSSDGTVMLGMERKTLSDFSSSIRDGRYSEQRRRLIGALGVERVVYVVEGGGSMLYDSFGRNEDPSMARVRGAMTSLLVNHRIPVAFTRDTEDTAAFVMRSTKSMLDAVANSKKAYNGGGYEGAACRSSVATAKKRDMVDGRQCFLQQMCQIPFVSHSVATRIAETLNVATMSQLVRVLDALPGEKERIKALQQVPSVGKTIAQRVLSFL
jgi:ERCC4-type nuclease